MSDQVLRTVAGRSNAPRAYAVQRFVCDTRGAVAIESAIAISILVAAFAGLMALVQESYASDRMGRAAWAVARAVALDPQADPCTVIRRELALPEAFNCDDRWHITVNEMISASSLSTVLSGSVVDGSPSGDLVLVRVRRNQGTDLNNVDLLPDPDSTAMVAVGLARSEPEAIRRGPDVLVAIRPPKVADAANGGSSGKCWPSSPKRACSAASETPACTPSVRSAGV